jgi:hypothetical protein
VFLESVKDDLIPHIYEKKSSKEVYDSLVGLYQSRNIGQKLHLKNQLQVVDMYSSKMDISYFIWITWTHDQLASISETIEDVDLVNVALRGLPGSWEPFVQGIFS